MSLKLLNTLTMAFKYDCSHVGSFLAAHARSSSRKKLDNSAANGMPRLQALAVQKELEHVPVGSVFRVGGGGRRLAEELLRTVQ